MEEIETRANIQVLNRDAIKYVAMVTMLLNHIAHVFLIRGTALYEVFEDAGCFTAPVMCYFLVEGYAYTRSRAGYGLRLLAFTVISQAPFYLALRITVSDNFFALNMFFTLLCAFLILVVREKITDHFWRGTVCGILVLVTIIGDWQIFAALLVFLLAENWGDKPKMMLNYGATALVYGMFITRNYVWDGYGMPEAFFHGVLGCIGIVAAGITVLFLYNGRRAEHGRSFSKWFFYIFYPAHLLILYLASAWMQGRFY